MLYDTNWVYKKAKYLCLSGHLFAVYSEFKKSFLYFLGHLGSLQKSSNTKMRWWGQWLIAQLVERSLSVMKDPGSNLGADICSVIIDL